MAQLPPQLPPQLLPWGRFKLVSKDPADESDHLYFYRNAHKIGRNRKRSDIIIDKLFISSIHCEVTLEEADADADSDANGDPAQYTVKIQDFSRNAVYVNEVRVGKSKTEVLEPNFTVHFTKPGLSVKGVVPHVYKFEIFDDGFSAANTQLRNAMDAPGYTPDMAASSAAAAASGATSMIRPTQDMAEPALAQRPASAAVAISPTQELAVTQAQPRKRRMNEADLEQEVATNMSSGHDAALSVSSSAASGSPFKKQRRDGSDAADAGSDDELNTSTLVHQSNRKLRQKLQDSKSREEQLSKQLSDAELEILSLNEQLDDCREHGKKLQEELGNKDVVIDEHEKLIAQLREEKLAVDTKLAESVKALAAANDKLRTQSSAIEELEKDNVALGIKLETVTAHYNSSLANNGTLNAQVKELEVKRRELENNKMRVYSMGEIAEESIRDVEAERDILGDTLLKALQVFEVIHKQVARGAQLSKTAGVTKFIERRRRHSEDSTEHSSSNGRFTDSSLLLSETSQPTPVNSSDVNTQDPDDTETLDQEAALAHASLPTTNPLLTGVRQAVQQQQLALEESAQSEPQQIPAEAQHNTPADRHLNDSEESVASILSSSRTPPAKPLPTQSEQQHGDDGDVEAEVEVVQEAEMVQEVVVVETEAVAVAADGDEVGDAAADGEKHQAQELDEDEPADIEDNADDSKDEKNGKVTAEAKADDNDDDDGDDVVIVEQPAAMEMDQSDTTADSQTADASAAEEKENDGDDDDDEPLVTATRSSATAQANVSEGAGIFDDETQLSQ